MSGETLPGGAAADHHMQEQFTLALPAPPVASDDLLVPARMVNEWVYCPRLAYLEWVEGQWAESADTADGTRRHRRVDQGKGKLPPAADLDPANADTGANADNGKDTTGTPDRMQTRSVELGSHSLGLVAKIDLLEIEDGMVAPVDYKRGKRPHREKGAHEPERVQLCAQALILDLGPADRIDIAVESLGKPFQPIERKPVVI
tara:strand:+ start:11924 stop:12532 length:609 start_codon:yes stop_codon:yes gene_type:complete